MTMKPLVFVFALLALVVLLADQSALASRELNEKPKTQSEMNKQAQPQGFGGGYHGQGGGSYYPGHGGGGGGGGGGYYPGHGGGGGGYYCRYRCGYYHRCCSAAEYHAELAKADGKGN